MISFIKVLLLLSLLLIPSVAASKDYGFEQSKVIFFIFLNTSVAALWLIWQFRSGQESFKWTTIQKAGLVFLFILLLSSILGIDPKISLLGKDPYFQGWILYAQAFLFMLIVSTIGIKFIELAKVITLSALVISLVAIKEAISLYMFNMDIPNYAGRVVSTFGQPNLYSGFLLLALPFCYFLAKKSKSYWYPSTLMLIVMIGILISLSKSSILLLAGLISWWLIKVTARGSMNFSKIAFLVLYLLVFSLSLLYINSKANLLGAEFFIPYPEKDLKLTDYSSERRIYLWPPFLDLISQKPILGYGLETIEQSFSSYIGFYTKEAKPLVFYDLRNLKVDRTHNYILDLLMFSGILGLLAWILFIVVVIRKAKGILLVSVIVYLIWIQFQIQGVVHLLYFWLLVGLVDQQNSKYGS